MSTVTVNKLDTQSDESEFAVETLDDVQSGGASSSSKPNLSVPLNNNSVNNLEKTNTSSIQQANTPDTKEVNSKQDENISKHEEESEFPPEEQEKIETMPSKDVDNTEDKELVTNLESIKNNTVSTTVANINTTQKTKKRTKRGVKKTGVTKKKQVAPSHPIDSNVQPHVEFGNERGTMTIKYASAKTIVPLYSTAKGTHLDLSELKSVFDTEYETVKGMTSEQVTQLRHEMQNTDFDTLGSDALIHGLLSLIDDHDTKKLTLKMMLARGILKVKA